MSLRASSDSLAFLDKPMELGIAALVQDLLAVDACEAVHCAVTRSAAINGARVALPRPGSEAAYLRPRMAG